MKIATALAALLYLFWPRYTPAEQYTRRINKLEKAQLRSMGRR